MSLDGFIADEEGGYAWIPMDDDIDFTAFLSRVDTLLMGRGTYETAVAAPESAALLDAMRVFVVSTTMDPDAHPGVTVIGDDVQDRVRALKNDEGKDIWLFGGGVLFRSLLEAGLVDRVELAVIPSLLGAGIPVVPGLESVVKLVLHSSETFDSGIVLMKYDVEAD